VPYRQWVLSLPRRVRFLLACDSDLLGEVVGIFLRKVFAWQRRRARARGIRDAWCGAVTFVQRFGSLLNLNCHAHALLPEGVFADDDGRVTFHPLPPPWDEDVERLVRQVARAVTARVQARGDGKEAETDVRMLDQAEAMAPASSSSLSPPATAACGRRTGFELGYSLHADRLVEADDREALERLCRYGARSPIAHHRLSTDAQGRVVLSLRKPLRDGRAQLAFTPMEFLRRLAALIPPPRVHLTRYHGLCRYLHRPCYAHLEIMLSWSSARPDT